MIKVFSLGFWKKHIKEAVFMAAIGIISTAYIMCLLLIMRSIKAGKLEEIFRSCGKYDYVLNYMSPEAGEILNMLPGVTEYGAYYDLGNAYPLYSEESEEGVLAGCYFDEISEQLFYFPCELGRYPREKGEVAVDYDTALKMGVYPEVGTEIDIKLTDVSGNYAVEGTYTICGVYRLHNTTFTTDERYQYNRLEEGEDWYRAPLMMFDISIADNFRDKKISCFWQNDFDIQNIDENYDTVIANYLKDNMELGTEDYGRIFIPLSRFVRGRAKAYSVLSINEIGYVSLGGFEQIFYNGELKDKNRDAYVNYLIPVLLVCTFIAMIISISGIQSKIIGLRMKQLDVMRRLGVSVIRIIFYSVAEFIVMQCLIYLPGSLLGVGCYEIILSISDKLWTGGYVSAFGVDSHVRYLTFNPWVWSAVVPMAAGIIALIIELRRRIRKYPGQKAVHRFGKREESRRIYTNDSCVSIYNRGVSWGGNCRKIGLFAVLAISIGTLFFAYRFVREETWQYRSNIINRDYDFQIGNSRISGDFYGVESGLSLGLDSKTYVELEQDDATSGIISVARRNSSKIVFGDGINKECVPLPTDYSIVGFEAEPYEKAGILASFKAMGFENFDDIFGIPTIALRADEKNYENLFADSTVYGSFDYGSLSNGGVAIIWMDDRYNFDDYFTVGQSIMVSEVIIYPEADAMGFDSMEIYEVTKPVYYVMDETGENYKYASFCFGTRKDYEADVQAVIIPSEKLQRYLGIEKETGIFMLTTLECLEKNDIDKTTYENTWIWTNGNAQDSEFASGLYEICSKTGMSCKDKLLQNIEDNRNNSIHVPIIWIACLGIISIGTVGFIGIMRMDITRQYKNLAIISALGCERKRIAVMLFRQYVFLPIIGTMAGIIPILAFQININRVRREMYSGIVTSMTGVMTMPYNHNYFRDDWVIVLTVIILVHLMLIWLITLNEIYRINITPTVNELRDE